MPDHAGAMARAREMGLPITPYTFRSSAVKGYPDVTAEMVGVMNQRYRVAFGLPGETRGRRRRSCPGA